MLVRKSGTVAGKRRAPGFAQFQQSGRSSPRLPKSFHSRAVERLDWTPRDFPCRRLAEPWRAPSRSSRGSSKTGASRGSPCTCDFKGPIGGNVKCRWRRRSGGVVLSAAGVDQAGRARWRRALPALPQPCIEHQRRGPSAGSVVEVGAAGRGCAEAVTSLIAAYCLVYGRYGVGLRACDSGGGEARPCTPRRIAVTRVSRCLSASANSRRSSGGGWTLLVDEDALGSCSQGRDLGSRFCWITQ